MQGSSRYNLKRVLLFGLLILVLAGIIGFFVVRSRRNPAENQLTTKNVFPFGEGTAGTIPKASGVPGTDDSTGSAVQNPLSQGSSDPLRQITTYPVTGFFASVVNKVVSEPKTDEASGLTSLVSSVVPSDMLRFNVKQNGIIMDAEVSHDLIITSQKTTSQVPDPQEIWFGNGGNSITFRSWNEENKNITSYVGTFPPVASLGYCTVPLTKDVKRGSKDNEIKELQKYLNAKLKIGMTVDGVIGKKTYDAIKGLQNVLGIKETGLYDQATREAINVDCAKIVSAATSQNGKPVALTGSFLASNILRGTVSPDGARIFFLQPTSSGVVGIVAKSDGSGQQRLFQSPLTEWKPQWVNATTIAMTTLASREASGYLYFLNVTNGDFRKVLGPIRGLTTNVSPDASTVLVSQSTDRGLILASYSTATGAMRKLDLVTLPAKCAWQGPTTATCAVPQILQSGQYPDDWYQGNVTFNDAFWTMDLAQNSTRLLFTPSQAFDVSDIGMSPDNAYLYFINRIDGTLWSYRMGE